MAFTSVLFQNIQRMIQIFITLSFVFIITLLILHPFRITGSRKIPTIRDSGAAGSGYLRQQFSNFQRPFVSAP